MEYISRPHSPLTVSVPLMDAQVPGVLSPPVRFADIREITDA